MKIKSILSIAAFTAAFIFSIAFAGLFVDKSEIKSVIAVQPSYNNQRATSCWKSRKSSESAVIITKILEQDDRNGITLDRDLSRIGLLGASPFKSPSFEQYADATGEYADESGSIEDDRLPLEFQTAWRDHIKAWGDYADFLESTKSADVRTEMGEGTFETMSSKYNANISLTWLEVLDVAAKYGSDFKPKH